MNCLMPIDLVQVAATQGHQEPVGGWEQRQQYSVGTYYVQRVASCNYTYFAQVLRHVESEAQRFARQAAMLLEYGDAVQGIWEGYRAEVSQSSGAWPERALRSHSRGHPIGQCRAVATSNVDLSRCAVPAFRPTVA